MRDQADVEAALDVAQTKIAGLATELATAKANVAALTRSEKGLTERLIEQGRRLDEALASLKSMSARKQPARRTARRVRKNPPAASGQV